MPDTAIAPSNSTTAAPLVSPGRPLRRAGRNQAGLDIGAHAAKLVIRQWRGGTWRITGAGCLRISSATLSDATNLAAALRPWLRDQEGLRRCNLVCNLPSALVDYETVELGSGDRGTAAKDAIAQLLGEEFAKASFDYWCGAAPGKDELHLAWTGSDFAAQIANRLASESGRFRAIDVPAAALARVATNGSQSNKPCLIADIGQGEVSLVWVCGGVAGYVRNRIQFAPQTAAADLASILGVRMAAAETLLAAWGLGDAAAGARGPIPANVELSLGDWLKKLRFEISRTIQFLQHRYGYTSVPELVIAGGGACIRGLAPWLQSQLRLPVQAIALPRDWIWEAAEPYSPLYSQALALTQYGDLT